ncbi:hypothetical protein GBAR_LOCUS8492 [Geodia barretti]|uniref:CUB domain-containing protein n=1 Tax=Geodia barretti TaxID=519541 RepID=A0AA35WDM0_GEOBA|nr:hypothetical protein GBAR_LOCUS8492 [Geodia barretti]
MTTSIAVCVLIFVGTPGICSQCVGDYYYAKLQPNISDDSEGYTFNFACSTNLQTTYPRWEINNQDYDVTDLPRDFIVSGPNVEFKGARSLKVRCYINTFINGSVDRVYSNNATIMRADIQGYTLPERPKENVTFSNHREVSNMHVDVQHYGGDCDISIAFSRCNNSDITEEQYVTLSGESNHITIEIDTVEMFYEHDIIVTMNYSCSDNPKIFYIPNMNQTGYTFNFTGTIIDDLSNDYCDFGSPHIDYKICILSPQGSNECFETPCGNGKIYTSLCSENYQNGTVVSLEVSEAENGTIISIFCQSNDCRGKPSNVMVFNTEVLMSENCDENSECVKGQCVCKDNTENGTSKDSTVAEIAGGVVGGVVGTLLLLAIIVIIIITKYRL